MITPIYASLIALIFVALSVSVVRFRRTRMVSLGDGGHEELNRRIRAHGNCAEYAPIGLLLILMLELQSGPALLIHLCGLMFLIGRASHGYALTFPESTVTKWRVIGMVGTYMSINLAAIANLVIALFY